MISFLQINLLVPDKEPKSVSGCRQRFLATLEASGPGPSDKLESRFPLNSGHAQWGSDFPL